MNERTRLNPNDRQQIIWDHAYELAAEFGYENVTRGAVATRAGVSPALVSHYMGTVGELQHRIIRLAILKEDPRIVAQAVLARHPLAADIFLSESLVKSVKEYITESLL